MALLTTFRHQFFDDNGDPLNGGKVYFFEAGTSTPKDTFTTSAGDVANANPVILNSRGEATIFTNGLYTIDLKTSTNAQVTGYPVDNVGAGSSNNDAALRWGGTSTGSANAHVLSPTTSITAYAIGQSFVWKAGYTNTGAATIAVSGLSAIAMQKQGAALDANDVLLNKFYTLVLDTLTTAQLMVGNANLAVLATLATLATTATNQSGGTVAATTISASSSILSSSATGGIGYATGAGGTVTQNTNKNQPVTLNKACGTITTSNSNLNAGAETVFALTSSAFDVDDGILVHLVSAAGAGIFTNYEVSAGIYSGSGNAIYIKIKNNTAGALAEVLTISFVIIKGVSA